MLQILFRYVINKTPISITFLNECGQIQFEVFLTEILLYFFLEYIFDVGNYLISRMTRLCLVHRKKKKDLSNKKKALNEILVFSFFMK